jgi:hypothetical protein
MNYPCTSLNAFKEGHATKPAEGSKHNNNNIRVHLEKYVHTTSAPTKAEISPITTKS